MAEEKRSPIRFSLPEISFASIAIVTFLYLFNLGVTEGDVTINNVANPDWAMRGLKQLFTSYAPKIGIFTLIGSISFIRFVRNDVKYFSRPGHFVLSFPMIPVIFYLSPLLIGFCLPAFTFASFLLACLFSSRLLFDRELKSFGDILAIPVTLAWLLVNLSFGMDVGDIFLP